jgi:twinkle protein
MLRQFWAERRPTEEQIARALEWLSGKVWIYDLMGNVATDKILSLQEFSTRRHNVTHFVIDSLMKCNVDGDDYNAQRKFLNEAATFAKRNDCHTHIIAHPRKGDEEKPVNRFCISGSGDISNQADNIVSVWRNKAKERNEKTWSKYDAVILCDKQRETGWEGYITLDFAKNIEQYLVPGQEATKYFEWAFKPEPQDEQEQINFDEPPPPEPPPTYDTPLPSSWASDVPTEGTMI